MTHTLGANLQSSVHTNTPPTQSLRSRITSCDQGFQQFCKFSVSLMIGCFSFFCHGNQGQRVFFTAIFPSTMHQQEDNNVTICSGYAKRYVYIMVHTGGKMEISLRTEKPQRNEPIEQHLHEVIKHRYGREWQISMFVIST